MANLVDFFKVVRIFFNEKPDILCLTQAEIWSFWSGDKKGFGPWKTEDNQIIADGKRGVYVVQKGYTSGLPERNLLATRMLLDADVGCSFPDMNKCGAFGEVLVVQVQYSDTSSYRIRDYDLSTFTRDLHALSSKYCLYQYMIDSIFPVVECAHVAKRAFEMKQEDDRLVVYLRGFLGVSKVHAKLTDYERIRRHLFGAFLKLTLKDRFDNLYLS